MKHLFILLYHFLQIYSIAFLIFVYSELPSFGFVWENGEITVKKGCKKLHYSFLHPAKICLSGVSVLCSEKVDDRIISIDYHHSSYASASLNTASVELQPI